MNNPTEEIINHSLIVKLHNREQTIIKLTKLLLEQDLELKESYLREKTLAFQCSVKDLELSGKLLEIPIVGKKELIEKYKCEIANLNKSLSAKHQQIASLKDQVQELKYQSRDSFKR